MPLVLPTLPPLPPYPVAGATGAPPTAEALAAWRDLARLHIAVQDLQQREKCHEALIGLQESLGPVVDQVLTRWAAHDAITDKHAAAIDALTAAVKGVQVGGVLPIELVTALLVAIVGALRAP